MILSHPNLNQLRICAILTFGCVCGSRWHDHPSDYYADEEDQAVKWVRIHRAHMWPSKAADPAAQIVRLGPSVSTSGTASLLWPGATTRTR